MQIEREKHSKTRSTFSFSSLLSWFGTFTPQFKAYLHSIRQQNDEENFSAIIKDIFLVFRRYLLEISKIPKGSQRASWAHREIDNEIALSPSTFVSCKKGCNACCFFEKQITEDEAELIIEFVQSEGIKIDETKVFHQATRYDQGIFWDVKSREDSRCVFLDEQGACGIYSVRPAVCRKHRVTSPPQECVKGPEGQVEQDSQLMPELITSVALSLPDNTLGAMPLMLREKMTRTGAAGQE